MMMQDNTEILKILNEGVKTPLSKVLNSPEIREQLIKLEQSSFSEKGGLSGLSKLINSPELREQISKFDRSQLRPSPMLVLNQMLNPTRKSPVIVNQYKSQDIKISANPISKPIPQPKRKIQKGGNRVTQLQKQVQIDILKNVVIELCRQSHGKAENERLTVFNISNKALATNKLRSTKTLDRYIKSLNLSQTAKEYVGQLVRQYCKDNSLINNYFQ